MIKRCLEKNPDHRAFLVELLEHPFFTELPENDYHVSVHFPESYAFYNTLHIFSYLKK